MPPCPPTISKKRKATPYVEGGIGAYQKPKNRPKFPPNPKIQKKNRSKPKNH